LGWGVGARQQEPEEIDTGTPISDDDCSGLVCGGGGSGHWRLSPFTLELCPIDQNSPFFQWRRPTYHEGYMWLSSL